MKNRTLAAMLLFVVMLGTCFVSTPVVGGEHPWDADGGDDEDPLDPRNPNPVDTVDVLPGGMVASESEEISIWYTDLTVTYSVWITAVF